MSVSQESRNPTTLGELDLETSGGECTAAGQGRRVFLPSRTPSGCTDCNIPGLCKVDSGVVGAGLFVEDRLFLRSCSSRNWLWRSAALNIQILSRLFNWSSPFSNLEESCFTCSESSSIIVLIVSLSFLTSSSFCEAQDICASWVSPHFSQCMPLFVVDVI